MSYTPPLSPSHLAADLGRELLPWEKADARKDFLRYLTNKAPVQHTPGPVHFPKGKGYDPYERDLQSREVLDDLKARIDYLGDIHVAAISAGASSPIHTTPTELVTDNAFHDYALLSNGQIADISELDGLADLYEPPEESSIYTAAEAQALCERDGEFVFFCKNRAGEITPAEDHAAALKARKEIHAQSMDLALGLATQGIDAFQPKHAPRASLVDPFTESRIDAAPLRRVNFFPAVAKARRAGMLVHLNAWVETNTNTRMFTFTSGGRVRLDTPGAIRSRLQFLHRRLSNLNAHPYLKQVGCTFSFRASEAGTLYRACPFPRVAGTEQGVVFAHLHAHVFANFEHQLSPKQLKKFLRRVKSIWRFHWDFGRRIENAAEACKYPVKPGDLAILTDPEKAAWYRETRKLHMVQPLGGLREAIAARHEIAFKGRKWRVADRETGTRPLKLRFTPDWNARPRISAEQRAARDYQRERVRRLGLGLYCAAADLLIYANALLNFEKRVRRDEHRRNTRAVEDTREALAAARRQASRGRIGPFLPTRAYSAAFAAHEAAKARHAAGPAFRLSPTDHTAILAQIAALRASATTYLRAVPHHRPTRNAANVARYKKLEAAARPQKVIINQVCARIGPTTAFDRITRPALLVWNFNGDYAALRELPFVKKYHEATKAQIAAAEAQVAAENSAPATHRVHTSHITATRARPRNDDPPSLLSTAEVWRKPENPETTPSAAALAPLQAANAF